MQINVTFRQLDSSSELKSYAETRLQKLKKYAEGPMDVNVVLSVEKFRNTAEVIISGDGIRAAAKEVQEDMHAAIDLVSDKIEKQLKKFRDKLVSRRSQAGGETASAPPSRVGADEALYQVVTAKKMESKPMSVEEAAAQLPILGQDFLVFRNSDTELINVLYWRKDGTLGLIEP